MATDAANARVVKRSLVIAGHRTSVSLEDAFWRRLRRIAAERGLSLNALAAMVDASRGDANLSSAIRVFVLEAQGPAPPAGKSQPTAPFARISKARLGSGRLRGRAFGLVGGVGAAENGALAPTSSLFGARSGSERGLRG